jgi:osmotically-inducible protein OsmY
MARKKSGKQGGQPKSGSARGSRPAVNRRTIKRESDSTQLLERGETPTAEEQLDPSVDSPSEITADGGPATDSSYRYGGPRTGAREPDSRGTGGTGGEGGYSTLGGGVYPDEGAPEDAPSYGDWGRHSTGATSGARGREGLGFPGERTWGEAQSSAERREEQGRSRPAPRSVRRSDERLADDIRDILTNDPELDARDIEVEVEGGAVTLSGAVADSDAKLLAEELVETLPGVREIHNRLRVEPRED